ncbi:MAG: hypothetical protein LQ343_004935 [Gyalolechia ehrenbergii]|nr:MAG: hypothetical protein LQ343_004935 [Gyalolechia ehrenbergii]
MTDVQSRPNTADITRHMANVNDDESMVIRSLARQPDTLTAAARSNVGRINGELNSATSLAEQAAALAIDIVHVAGKQLKGYKQKPTVKNVKPLKKLLPE